MDTDPKVFIMDLGGWQDLPQAPTVHGNQRKLHDNELVHQHE